jgi:hypothetical protein
MASPRAITPSHTRLYHRVSNLTCSFAHAVSQRDVRKILYNLSVIKYTSEYDNMLHDLCDGERGRDAQFTCMTMQPALFTHWRPPGTKEKESDIAGNDDELRQKRESVRTFSGV